jgi:hypothetical protein
VGPITRDFEQNFDDIEATYDMLVGKGYGAAKIWASEWAGIRARRPKRRVRGWLTEGHEQILNDWGSFVESSTYFEDLDTVDYPTGGVAHGRSEDQASAMLLAAVRISGRPQTP